MISLARERGVKITLVPSLFLQVIVEDLGKLQDEVTEVVSMVAQRALLHQSAFTLKLSGLRRIETPMGAFLVVGVLDNARRLTLLRADLHRALLDYGFTLDERPYCDQVLLARVAVEEDVQAVGVDIADAHELIGVVGVVDVRHVLVADALDVVAAEAVVKQGGAFLGFDRDGLGAVGLLERIRNFYKSFRAELCISQIYTNLFNAMFACI